MRRALPALLLLASSAMGAEIRFDPPAPDTTTFVHADVGGVWGNGCWPRAPHVERNERVITATLTTPGGGCLSAVMPWRERVPLGLLPPGLYEVVVRIVDGRRSFEWIRGHLVVRDASMKITPAAISASTGSVRVFIQTGTELPPFGDQLDPAQKVAVTFGGVPASAIWFGYEHGISVIPPIHEPGTVDVAITWPDGIRRVGVAAFTYFEAAAAVDRALHEPILFPVAYDGPGALATRWTTENTFRSIPDVYWREPVPPMTCGNCVTTGTWIIKASPVATGILMWAPRGRLGQLQASSSIRETTRGVLGVDVPVVRENDFRRGSVALLNVAHGPKTRATLRIYALGNAPLTVFVNVLGSSTFGFLPETTLLPVGNGLLFASMDISSLRPMRLDGPVTVSVDSSSLFAELWAMTSTTDNETQHVTVNWPR